MGLEMVESLAKFTNRRDKMGITDRSMEFAVALTKSAIDRSGDNMLVPERIANFLEVVARKIDSLYTEPRQPK